jgi:hypothetical protein
MIGKPEVSAGAGSAREPGEDTIVLELTAARQLELSQAANAAARPPEIAPGKPGHDSFVCRRTERMDFVSTLTFAALVLGITAASTWHALVGQPTAPFVAIAVSLAPAPAANEHPRGPVVQVINPFDATEVFEFPAGTTESDTRNAIAELLLQRAGERRRQGLDLRRASNRDQPPPIAADNPPDIFVSRLSGPTNGFAGTPSLRAKSGMADSALATGLTQEMAY